MYKLSIVCRYSRGSRNRARNAELETGLPNCGRIENKKAEAKGRKEKETERKEKRERERERERERPGRRRGEKAPGGNAFPPSPHVPRSLLLCATTAAAAGAAPPLNDPSPGHCWALPERERERENKANFVCCCMPPGHELGPIVLMELVNCTHTTCSSIYTAREGGREGVCPHTPGHGVIDTRLNEPCLPPPPVPLFWPSPSPLGPLESLCMLLILTFF